MNKILLITDYYLPNNNANGMCIHRLAKALKKKNCDVHVIAYQQGNEPKETIIDGIKVYRIRPQFFYTMRKYYWDNSDKILGKLCWKLALLSRRIKKILFMPWYPLTSIITCERFYNEIYNYVVKNNIKNIISGYNPFESAYFAYRARTNEDINVIMWFMDTFTQTWNAKSNKIIYKTGIAWEKRLYSNVLAIANFPLYKVVYSGTHYKKWAKKMFYADVPIDFEELDNVNDDYSGFENATFKLIYTGGLSMDDRDPEYLLSLFEKVPDDDVRLHFFSRGNAEELLLNKSRLDKRIIQEGQVPFEELLKARKNADGMINIGSKKTTILPSRIFEYIATKKPIIHIYYRDDDPCIEYLLKYPLVLLVDARKPVEKNISILRDFLAHIKYCENQISDNEIRKIYCDNDADNLASLFFERFERG